MPAARRLGKTFLTSAYHYAEYDCFLPAVIELRSRVRAGDIGEVACADAASFRHSLAKNFHVGNN